MFAADSSYLIALFLKNDEHSKRARELYEQIKYEKILINFTIINEVMNSFKKKNYEIEPNKAFNSRLNVKDIDYLNMQDFKEAMKIFN